MTIELNNYGFTVDSNWCYVALSWQLLIAATLSIVAFKLYKKMKGSN